MEITSIDVLIKFETNLFEKAVEDRKNNFKQIAAKQMRQEIEC